MSVKAPVNLEQIRELYHKGLTYLMIAERTGLSRSKVQEVCKAHFVPPGHHRNIDHNLRKKGEAV